MKLKDEEKKIKRQYTIGEEIANALTHGIGIIFSIVALVILDISAVLYGNIWHVVSYSIFGASMIILYTASTIYHSVRNSLVKSVLDVIDHSTIFILIAGTYTAISLTVLRETSGWYLFGFQWALALIGILSKIFFMEKVRKLSVVLYAVMGWMIVFAWNDLILKISGPAMWLLIAGGLAYTFGIIFYSLKKVKWFHSIWHVFVIGGTVCHFLTAIALVIIK